MASASFISLYYVTTYSQVPGPLNMKIFRDPYSACPESKATSLVIAGTCIQNYTLFLFKFKNSIIVHPNLRTKNPDFNYDTILIGH